MCIAAVALLTISCLDERPHDRIDEDKLLSTPEQIYRNTVAALYSQIGGNKMSQGLQGTERGIYDLNTLTTDEAMLPTRGGDWYDGGLWQSMYLHTWDGGLSPAGDAWNYLFRAIVLCNEAQSLVDEYRSKLSSDQYDSYSNEIRALRCLFYYYVLDLYARVPYLDHYVTDLKDSPQLERSQLFYRLYNDLYESLTLLRQERSNAPGPYYGRITRDVAFFLLAKMALNAEVWTDDVWTDDSRPDGKTIMLKTPVGDKNAWEACLYWCDMLGTNNKLEEEYEDNFKVHNEDSKENIFVIPMDKNEYTNIFRYLHRSYHYSHGAALGMACENGTCATVSTANTFGYGTENEDSRWEKNFYSDEVFENNKPVLLDDGTPLIYRPLEVALDLSGTKYEKTAGARMKKYENDPTALNDGQLVDNDIVLFRYADVLLMESEALWRLGWEAEALVPINQVRSRADMDLLTSIDEQTILDERLKELAWEGWRRQDLIRFDRYHKAYDQRPQAPGEADRHTIVFPIQGRLFKMNDTYTQNPGY